MEKRLIWLFTVFICILFIAAACGSDDNEQAGDAQVVPGDQIPQPIPSPTLHPCSISDIQDQDPCPGSGCSPADGNIIPELEPEFVWTYPFLAGCQPTGYEILVATKGSLNFPDVYQGVTTSYDPQIGGPATSMFIGVPLQPITQYQWRVTALVGSYPGGQSTQEFWTGPVCATSSLVAPDLLSPSNNSTVYDSFPPMVISYPGQCIPENFVRELSEDPDFAGPNLVDMPEYASLAQIPNTSLGECKEYYWRAKAVNHDGEGPYSDTYTFSTNINSACFQLDVGLFVLEEVTCFVGPGPLFSDVRTLMGNESYEVFGRNELMTWLYLGDCWAPVEAGELSVDIAELEVVPSPEQEPPPEPGMPEFSTNMLYYRGNGCGPKELTVRFQVNEETFSVVLFHRLADMESEAKTEWTAVAMMPEGDDYYSLTLQSEVNIPDFLSYSMAYLQIQIVATDDMANETYRTQVSSEVIFEVCSS